MNSEREYFFITGLPRSRTAWLANFFTWGQSRCVHDAIKQGVHADAIAAALQGPGPRYMGDADAGLAFLAPGLNRVFPNARWLVVRRDFGGAIDSFLKFFASRPYPGVSNDRAAVTEAFERCAVAVGELAGHVPAERRKHVEFDELDSNLVLHECWNFLTPENPWCAARARELQLLQVNVRPEKARFAWQQ